MPEDSTPALKLFSWPLPPRYVEHIPAGEEVAAVVRILVDRRPWLTDLGVCHPHDQVAVLVDARGLRSTELELNGARICPGRQQKIVFEPLLVPVEHQVDAGIDV